MNHRINFALMMASLMGDFTSATPWDKDFMAEKSNLPKKQPMPLTEEESEKLSRLHGKYKKEFLNEMRKKYE